MNNKRKRILATILVLLMLGVPSSVYAYNAYNYNKFYKQGLTDLTSEKYDEAISNFNASLKFKKNRSEEINKQINLVKDLKLSKTTYDEAVTKLNDKKYLEAIPIFEKIKKDDDKRYNLSKEMISQCKNLYINENIDNCKKEVSDKKYLEGIKYLDLALKVDDKNGQVLKLKSEYTNLYITDNVDKAKKEANNKNYEEGIKYLTLALKVDAKAEEALKLKEEYTKAIQVAQEAAYKAENHNSSNSNNTTSNANNATGIQINLPAILALNRLPGYNSPSNIPHVYGAPAIKKEFIKLGFVFNSDTTAIYNKDDIRVGLVNSGEYWQLSTATWRNNVDDLFLDSMRIILGNEVAIDSFSYIDYALSMPNTVHKTPYVKTFTENNGNSIFLHIFVPK